MSRFVRILAFILLCAVVLSSFAIFSIFAVEVKADSGVKTLYDQNNTSPIVKEGAELISLSQLTATNGIKYHSAAYKEGWGVDNGGYTKTPSVQISPSKHYLKDGWYNGDTSVGTDGVDYLVIDFDISTDSNQFDQIYIQTLFYYGKKTLQEDGSYKGVRTTAQSGHYALLGDSGDNAYFVASTDTGTKLPIDVQSDEEWAHITMIVDATSETNRMMHLYYNGHYISSRICMTDNAVYLESIRFGLGTVKTATDLDNESFSLANATIKSFPVGYSGDLAAEKDNLGNVLYPLSSFADLGYCLDNLPENTIAKITHANSEETLVTKIEDLDGNLCAGDTVLLYRDIARKIVVPGVADGDTVTSAVKFELNGHTMVDPLVLTDYDKIDWIIRDENGDLFSYDSNGTSTYAKGAQVYTDGALTTDTLSECLSAAFPTGILSGKTLKFTFLKDTSIKYAAALKHSSCRVTYDLNKKTLKILSGGADPFQSADAASRVVIRDGKMINGVNNPVYLTNAASYYVVDVDLTLNESFCDQRSGKLFFINSQISTDYTVTSLKSYSGNSCYGVFDNCDIIMNGASPISFSNLRTSSARRGSMNNFVGVYNTRVEGNAPLIEINYFANEWKGADSAALANENKVTISIQGTNATVSDSNSLILSDLKSLTDLNNSYAFAEGFSGTANIYIDNSDINADRVLSSIEADALKIIKEKNVTVGNYSVTNNLVIKESLIKSGGYVFSNNVGSGENNGSISVLLHDDVKLSSMYWSAEGDSSVKVEFAEGVKLAYSYDTVYPFIATLNWTESTLVGDRPDTTTVKLSPIFANGMVLQGHKDINIYGTCSTIGATIEVKIGDNVATTTVRGDGKWCATLPPMEYAKGLTITINELGIRFPETKIENVNIGEIWMMSGQSNSVYGTYKMEDFAEYRSNADNFDNIYAFAVNQGQSIVERTETANSGWYKVTSKTLTKDDRYTGISAIAYVMATRLATELGEDVTIGIVDINFNGSTVEAWMSPENLAKVDPELNEKYNAYRSYYVANGVYPSASDVAEYGDYVKSDKLYQKMACACYNAMIAPIFDGFSIRGAIWYQGEGNAGSVTADSDGNYAAHFTGVRNTFREAFADEELPVFIIQIPPRMNNPFYFRALQYDMAKKDDNTYLVMSLYAGSTYSSNELQYTTPAGDSMVHYERRSPVGLALADSVLENIYGMGELSSPRILSVVKRDGAIVITFDRELTIDMGSEMLGFEIAGDDKQWVTASASYSDKTVTLTADGVLLPTMVRYGCDKSILVLEDGTEIIHNKSDGSFNYDADLGIVTITANGNVYVIDTADPAIIGGRMSCNVVATNGSALPLFVAVAE